MPEYQYIGDPGRYYPDLRITVNPGDTADLAGDPPDGLWVPVSAVPTATAPPAPAPAVPAHDAAVAAAKAAAQSAEAAAQKAESDLAAVEGAA